MSQCWHRLSQSLCVVIIGIHYMSSATAQVGVRTIINGPHLYYQALDFGRLQLKSEIRASWGMGKGCRREGLGKDNRLHFLGCFFGSVA